MPSGDLVWEVSIHTPPMDLSSCEDCELEHTIINNIAIHIEKS